jgi:hypothetical protein
VGKCSSANRLHNHSYIKLGSLVRYVGDTTPPFETNVLGLVVKDIPGSLHVLVGDHKEWWDKPSVEVIK